MVDQVEGLRTAMENAINAGDIEGAMGALQQLRELQCDVRLSLQPTGPEFEMDQGYQQRVHLLRGRSVDQASAERIARSCSSDAEALEIARKENLI